MGVAVQTLSIQDQQVLLAFSLRCIDAMALDDVWTLSARAGVDGAAEVGRQLSDQLSMISDQIPEASELMQRERYALNAEWPGWPGRASLSADAQRTLDALVQEQGDGLGDAAVAAMAWLREEVPEEGRQLLERIAELEGDREPEGDLRKLTKVLLAFAAGAALITVAAAAASGVAAPVAAAALLALKDLAVASFSIAATGAVGTIVMPPGSSPPPTAEPA